MVTFVGFEKLQDNSTIAVLSHDGSKEQEFRINESNLIERIANIRGYNFDVSVEERALAELQKRNKRKESD